MTTVDINFTGRDAEGMAELGRKLDKFISDSILENERSLRADGCRHHCAVERRLFPRRHAQGGARRPAAAGRVERC